MTRIILFSGVLALSFFLQGAHASEAERALREKISKVQRILQDPETVAGKEFMARRRQGKRILRFVRRLSGIHLYGEHRGLCGFSRRV